MSCSDLSENQKKELKEAALGERKPIQFLKKVSYSVTLPPSRYSLHNSFLYKLQVIQ